MGSTNEFETIDPEQLATTSGLELARKIISGDLPGPPMGKTLHFWMAEAEEGRIVFKGTPAARHYNPMGTVHGGWASTILDSALSCCVWTMLPAGKMFTTAEFKVNLVRPIFDTLGELACEGKVIHMGRTLATSEATLKTSEGKLLAHGTETCAIFDSKI